MTEYIDEPCVREQGLSIVITGGGANDTEIVLKGRLDALEAPFLTSQLDALVQSGSNMLLIDLSDVRFVDSAGLAVLIRARRETRRIGGDVVLVRPTSDDAFRVFRLTQFDQVFRMLDVREEHRQQ